MQALVTLNDPVYQEAAESLAKRVMKETAVNSKNGAGNLLDARLSYETRLVLSRDPTQRELRILRVFFEKTLAMSAKPSLVGAKMTVRKSSAQNQQDATKELQALAAVGSVLFNLDAALTR